MVEGGHCSLHGTFNGTYCQKCYDVGRKKRLVYKNIKKAFVPFKG